MSLNKFCLILLISKFLNLDILIDKQGLIENRALEVISLYGRKAMAVSAGRKFEAKILRFWTEGK